jgi:hypothetical protein
VADPVTPEELARHFHVEYERLAPAFGYETRRETAVPFDQLLESNRRLMIAVCTSVLLRFFPERAQLPVEEPCSAVDPAEPTFSGPEQ